MPSKNQTEYMREYMADPDRRAKANAQRRARMQDPVRKAAKAAADKVYREQRKAALSEEKKEELRKKQAEAAARWRSKQTIEKLRAVKQRYYASEKGKACKRREDAAYVAKGLRAEAEARRAAKGVSPARKAARRKWAKANPDYIAAKQALRRTKDRPAAPFDAWVLREAQQLAKLRAKTVGGAWEVDHAVPVSLGGTSEATNLQVVPAIWNRTKSNRHTERFFGA